MRIPRIICALSAITMICGVANAAPEKSSNPSEVQPIPLAEWWTMTPIDTSLKPLQVKFLNLYMDYPNAPEMNKLPKTFKQQLPRYITLHYQQLDPYAVSRFKVAQLLDTGMSFSEIERLQVIMKDLQQGKLPNEEDKGLLDKLVECISKDPGISLNSEFRSFFGYVASNPDKFKSKVPGILRDALLSSVGLTSRELKGLDEFAGKKSNSPLFTDEESAALNKFMLLTHIQNVDLLMKPEQLSYLQFAVDQNRTLFAPSKVAAFDRAVDRSRSVRQFKDEAFQANKLADAAQANKSEMEIPKEKQGKVPAAQFMQQQRNAEEITGDHQLDVQEQALDRQKRIQTAQAIQYAQQADRELQQQEARARYYEQQKRIQAYQDSQYYPEQEEARARYYEQQQRDARVQWTPPSQVNAQQMQEYQQ